MNFPAFREGDVVRLLSGGCKMTVTSVDGLHWIWVVYHDVEGRPHEVKYKTHTLYKVSPGE